MVTFKDTISEARDGPNIVALPLAAGDYMEIEHITRNKPVPDRAAVH